MSLHCLLLLSPLPAIARHCLPLLAIRRFLECIGDLHTKTALSACANLPDSIVWNRRERAALSHWLKQKCFFSNAFPVILQYFSNGFSMALPCLTNAPEMLPLLSIAFHWLSMRRQLPFWCAKQMLWNRNALRLMRFSRSEQILGGSARGFARQTNQSRGVLAKWLSKRLAG